MKKTLTWVIRKQGDKTLVIFEGVLNEEAIFQGLEELAGKVTCDLAGIRRINSEGATRWVQFILGLDAVKELSFVRCSIAVVNQMNMVKGFQGKGVVKSFYAPYMCNDTGEEDERLLTPDTLGDVERPPVFVDQGKTYELDELPDRYFAFLIDN